MVDVLVMEDVLVVEDSVVGLLFIVVGPLLLVVLIVG